MAAHQSPRVPRHGGGVKQITMTGRAVTTRVPSSHGENDDEFSIKSACHLLVNPD